MTPKPLTIYFHIFDGAGHIHACLGMAQALAKRGHKITILVNEASAGTFTKYGLTVLPLTRPKPAEDPTQGGTENPIKFLAEMILNSGLLGGGSPLEKMKKNPGKEQEQDANKNLAVSLYESAVDFDPQIEKALAEGKPDVIVLDSFLVNPAILKSKIPWIYLYSSNPVAMFINVDTIPPYGSGFATKSDKALWKEYLHYYNIGLCKPFQETQTKLYNHFNYTPTEHEARLEPNVFFLKSPYLNLYGYPMELDYTDLAPLPDKTVRVDAFCREDTKSEPFKLPEEFVNLPGDKLIYLSLGSMGSIDVDLMKRILGILEKMPYKVIVSKGPRADEYDLPANAWGESFLPQTQILPLVDLVITHGGNNTFTETFSFGKPMIVMPLFSDQYCNAQRISEKGYGARVDPYEFEDEDLSNAVERLLHDKELKQKLEKAAQRIKKSNSKQKACEQIEYLVENVWNK